MVFFVGEPREVCENSGKGLESAPEDCPDALPTDTFWAAPLVCDKGSAHYMDWHGWCNAGTCVGDLKPGTSCVTDEDCVEYVHIYHEGLIPSLHPDGPAGVPGLVPGTYSCTFIAKATRECAPPSITIGPETVTVADVVSVEWEEYAPESTPLGGCPNNGGESIFPGKRYAVDPSYNIRNKVALKATISPVVAGCTVHFRTWDIDDPFDQNNSGMPNVSVIDGDSIGPDNRGSDPAVVTGAGTTDANGEARFTVTVSMQPGNNYRAGASVVQSAINATTQVQADSNSPPQYVLFTNMLTVWRRLTLEVDSMDAESQVQADRESNGFEWVRFIVPPASGDIPAPIQVGVPDEGFTTLLGYMVPNPVPCELAYDNRWEGGALVAPGAPSDYLLVRNSCVLMGGETVSKFIVWGNPGDLTGFTSVIRDDDPYFTGGAPQQLPQASVLQLEMVNAYRDAYIEIVEGDSTENPDTIVPWSSNLGIAWLTASYLAGNLTSGVGGHRDLDSAPDFWVRRVLVCYQPGEGEDMDPDPFENGAISQNVAIPGLAPYPSQQLSALNDTAENKTLGVTVRGVTIGTALTTVYKETIRDIQVQGDPFAVQFWQIVAHEAGHATLDPSGNKLSEAAEHAEGGLMTEGGNLQNLPAMRRFASTTLVRFRDVNKW